MTITKFFVPQSVFFLLICLTLWALSRVDYSWEGWRPASCMPDNCFCEEICGGTIAQPANTWSSLGFIWMGLMVIGQFRQDRLRQSSGHGLNLMTTHAVCPWVFGVALVLTGTGSAFYHASLTFVGQFFDLMGMYLLASFILVYNFARLQPLAPQMFVGFYLLLNFTLACLLIEAPMLRRYLFAALLLVALVLEHRLRRQRSVQIKRSFLQIALSLLAMAFAIWVLDITRALCRPESWLQGHAAWHLLCAAAAGFLYFYYRSENAGR